VTKRAQLEVRSGRVEDHAVRVMSPGPKELTVMALPAASRRRSSSRAKSTLHSLLSLYASQQGH
jgi:hypothetical protein